MYLSQNVKLCWTENFIISFPIELKHNGMCSVTFLLLDIPPSTPPPVSLPSANSPLNIKRDSSQNIYTVKQAAKCIVPLFIVDLKMDGCHAGQSVCWLSLFVLTKMLQIWTWRLYYRRTDIQGSTDCQTHRNLYHFYSCYVFWLWVRSFKVIEVFNVYASL